MIRRESNSADTRVTTLLWSFGSRQAMLQFFTTRPFRALPEQAAEDAQSLTVEQASIVTTIMGAVRGQAAEAFAVLGRAGTGKTRVLVELARRAVRTVGRVLVVAPTGALADALRMALGQTQLVMVDTIDAAFRLWEEDPSFVLPPLGLILADEVGFIGARRFDAMIGAWQRSTAPCPVVFFGDFGQLTAPDGSGPATGCNFWRRVSVLRLRQCIRAPDPALQRAWARVRTKQCDAADRAFLLGRRLVQPVTAERLAEHFLQHPSTVILAVRIKEAKRLSDLCVQGLFCGCTELRTVPVVTGADLFQQKFFRGMRVMVTHNQNKSAGVVNGAFARVSRFQKQTLIVQLEASSRTVGVHRENLGQGAGYPVVPAYALTIAKTQGRTLPAVLIWPKHAAPAAAYTAISRIQRVAGLWWLGPPTLAWLNA
ncbi:unnamed protein product [Effrenium voratum]|nr:unnamed protein product [Effrenium voratum]